MMNNNAVFWMNLNNINTNVNTTVKSNNKNSTDLFDKALKSANKQPKVTLIDKDKKTSLNRLNDKELKTDNIRVTKEIKNGSKQTDKIDETHDINAQDTANKPTKTKTIEAKKSKNELGVEIEEDIIQNDSKELEEILSKLDEILEVLLNMSQQLVSLDNSKDIKDVLSNFDKADLSSMIQEISFKIDDLINHMSITEQAQSEGLLNKLQGIQNALDLISGNSTVVQEDNFISELTNKINELLLSIKKPEKSLSYLSMNINQSNHENLEIKEDNNNSNSLLSKDTEELNINLENEHSAINPIDSKADLISSNNNSYSQKPMQDILIDTVLNNTTSYEFNDLNTKIDKLNKIISLNKDSIFEQVVDKIKVNYKTNSDEVKIRLKPEILGEMTIKIVVEKGLVTAKAIVENYNIKQLLESNIDQLKESFKNEGLNFQALDVSVSKDSGFDRNDERLWTSKNKTKNKKIIFNDAQIGSLYEEINNNATTIMSMYSTSLDLTV